jgi:diacylglycerol kinase (ATP)
MHNSIKIQTEYTKGTTVASHIPILDKESTKPMVILNPASAGGKTGSNQSVIQKYLKYFYGHQYQLCVTSKPLEAEILTRRAIWEGYELIIAVGGDGTLQEVVNGFFRGGKLINPNCQLGIINSGTGQGLAQSLKLPCSIETQLVWIKEGSLLAIDVGNIILKKNSSHFQQRIFLNECQIGIGGEVCKQLHSRRKRLGGKWAFGSATLTTLLRYPANRIDVLADNRLLMDKIYIGIVIANGTYTGGGMNLTPYAQMDDGYLDLLGILNQSIGERLKNFSKIYKGKHLQSKKIQYQHVKQISLRSMESVPIAADGEFLGYLPCKIEIISKIIQIRYKHQ